GRMARRAALAGPVAGAAGIDVSGLAARLRDAVPGAAELLLRLPVDRVPALAGPARHPALALRAGGCRHVRRSGGDAAGRAGAGGRAGGGPADDPGRVGLGRVDPRPAAAGRARSDLACALVLRGDAAGPGRRAVLRRVRADGFGVAGVLRNQTGYVRTAAAGVPDGRAPHVPVLRRQRRAGLCALAADVAA